MSAADDVAVDEVLLGGVVVGRTVVVTAVAGPPLEGAPAAGKLVVEPDVPAFRLVLPHAAAIAVAAMIMMTACHMPLRCDGLLRSVMTTTVRYVHLREKGPRSQGPSASGKTSGPAAPDSGP